LHNWKMNDYRVVLSFYILKHTKIW